MDEDVGKGCYGHHSHDLSKSYCDQHGSSCTLDSDIMAPKRVHKRRQVALISIWAQGQKLLFFLDCDRYSQDQQGRTFGPAF